MIEALAGLVGAVLFLLIVLGNTLQVRQTCAW